MRRRLRRSWRGRRTSGTRRASTQTGGLEPCRLALGGQALALGLVHLCRLAHRFAPSAGAVSASRTLLSRARSALKPRRTPRATKGSTNGENTPPIGRSASPTTVARHPSGVWSQMLAVFSGNGPSTVRCAAPAWSSLALLRALPDPHGDGPDLPETLVGASVHAGGCGGVVLGPRTGPRSRRRAHRRIR